MPYGGGGGIGQIQARVPRKYLALLFGVSPGYILNKLVLSSSLVHGGGLGVSGGGVGW